MSESTFVQAQLIHLSRVAVYPVLGKVRIVISSQSLSEGIVSTLQNMAQLLNSSEQNLPEYWVVLAVRASSTIDFCVLVMDPLQVQLLYELKALNSDMRLKKQQSKVHNSLVSNPIQSGMKTQAGLSYLNLGFKLQISKELLLIVKGFQQKLNRGILIPFYNPNSMQESDSENVLAGIGLLKVDRAVADNLCPKFSHLVEHKPQGPFQDQYNAAMHMLQKILNHWGNQTKIEEYQKIDFRVLCPPEASFVSQTIKDLADSGLVEYLKLNREGRGKSSSGSARESTTSSSEGSSTRFGVNREIEERVICCGLSEDAARFQAFLKELESNKDTLYIVIAENAHLTNSVSAKDSASFSSSSSFVYSDNTKLLCDFTNCIILNISSHPYSLQTNRSFISFANEIYWPVSTDKSGLHFCSANDFKSNQFQNLESEFEYGVRFRDDQCFEEMFHEAVTNTFPRLVRGRYVGGVW